MLAVVADGTPPLQLIKMRKLVARQQACMATETPQLPVNSYLDSSSSMYTALSRETAGIYLVHRSDSLSTAAYYRSPETAESASSISADDHEVSSVHLTGEGSHQSHPGGGFRGAEVAEQSFENRCYSGLISIRNWTELERMAYEANMAAMSSCLTGLNGGQPHGVRQGSTCQNVTAEELSRVTDEGESCHSIWQPRGGRRGSLAEWLVRPSGIAKTRSEEQEKQAAELADAC